MECRKRFCLSAAALILLCTLPLASAEIAIVVSTTNPLASLTTEQATHIFLGKTARFPDGSSAIPVDLPEGSDTRDTFYQKLVGKTPAMMKAYWAKMIFTGKGRPPQTVPDAETAKRLIAAHPSYIGYLAEADLDSDVKVIPVSEGMLAADFE